MTATSQSHRLSHRSSTIHSRAWLRTGGSTSFALLVAMSGFPLCGIAADMDARPVSVVAARQQVLEQTVSVVGTVVARETTLVNAELTGARIASVSAEEGDLVTQGQLLAILNSAQIDVELLQNDAQASSASAQLGQASSALDNAAISREEAEADLQRAEKLVPKGLMSQEALEQRQKTLARANVAVDVARQAIKVAQAAVETVAAARKDIELRLSYTRIVAPVAGRIIRRAAKVGAIASSSGEQLFVIANDDQLELEAEVPQSQFNAIPVGAVAEVSLGEDEPTVQSTVRFIAPELGDRTRLGRARIPLPHGSSAPIGAFASARIAAGSNTGIFLPASAIATTGEASSIKILKDDRIEMRTVALGSRQAGFVQIRSGIDEGDLVVLKSGGFMDVGDAAVPVVVQADASTIAAADGGVR